MNKLLLLIAFVLLVRTEEEDGVLILDDKNIHDAIKAYPDLMIKFYAPWCGHCKSLAPEYAAAAKELKEKGYILAQVDATASHEAAKEFKVQGYPTVIFFHNGVKIPFTGDRNKKGIMDWIEERVAKSYIEISSEKDITSLTKKQQLSVVLVVKENDAESLTMFNEMLLKDDDFSFYLMKVRETPSFLNGSSLPAFMLIKKHEQQVTIYDGEKVGDTILNSFKLKSIPVFGIADSRSFKFAQANNKKIVIVFGKEFTDAEKEAYAELSKKNSLFVILNSDYKNEDTSRMVAKLEISEASGKAACILADNFRSIYLLEEKEATPLNVETFLGEYMASKLDKFAKSEKIPAESSAPVTKVVGKNIKKTIADTTKDVVVKYFGDRCPKCNEMAPMYTTVAGKVASKTKEIKFFEINTSLNEIEGFKFNGSPVIKFYPRNKKSGIEFKGEMTEKKLLDFISESTSLTVDLSEVETKKDL
jgi:protein disulfide-isomerase A1